MAGIQKTVLSREMNGFRQLRCPTTSQDTQQQNIHAIHYFQKIEKCSKNR